MDRNEWFRLTQLDSESGYPLFCYLNSNFMLGPFLAISTNNENSLRFLLLGLMPKIRLILQFRWLSITSSWSKKASPNNFDQASYGWLSVTGNGSGRVTEPKTTNLVVLIWAWFLRSLSIRVVPQPFEKAKLNTEVLILMIIAGRGGNYFGYNFGQFPAIFRLWNF